MTREEVLNKAFRTAPEEGVDEASLKKAYDVMLLAFGEDGPTKTACLGTWADEKSAAAAKEAINEALKTAAVACSCVAGFRVLSLTDEEFEAYTKKA